MNIIDIIILAFTICIDSFIICLITKTSTKKQLFIIPFIFSLFQILFLFVGYKIGSILEIHLKEYLKYIVFIIFSFMGLKMIIDTILNKEKENKKNYALKSIILEANLTSFDSLFLALPFAFYSNSYYIFLIIIGSITFVICLLALLLRNKISSKHEEKINLIGALILFFFAFKSLL